MKNSPVFPVLIILSIFFLFPNHSGAIPVNMAIPASGEGIKILLSWTPLIKHLEQETDLEINLIIVRDHKTIKEELEHKNYDFVLIDPFWYEHWKNTEICLPFLETISNQSAEYSSILIVHKSSIFRTLQDLENSNLALTVSDDSASGFYIPLALMFDREIDPCVFFKSIIFTETFESILKGVAYGKLDSGFITSDILYKIENKRYRHEIRVIMKSESLRKPIIVIRNDFNKEIMHKIRKTMISFPNSEKEKELLGKIGLSGFKIPGNAADITLSMYLDILELNCASPE
jgi:phosphate/phosphite/phosphonate ABC transporter binding protein